MNECFNAYGAYYDLLYQGKEYDEEADYLDRLIGKYGSADSPDSAIVILDMGCGTGRHAMQLNQRGYRVHGIDRSNAMLSIAKTRENRDKGLTFELGDVRSYRTDKKFNVIVSMFHVASYQTTNADLAAYFETAYFHLLPGGLFIFDFWYGPAVLSDPPRVRVKRVENDDLYLMRIAEPFMNPEKNTVEVRYEILIKDKSAGNISEIKETHRVRYLFLPELEQFVENVGFKILGVYEWMTEKQMRTGNWNGMMIVRK